MAAIQPMTVNAVGRGATPPSASVVRITPNRQRIDNRFPVLGFTVHTGNLPYFEVIVTADPRYFDPARADERTPTLFYASRQDSGLIAAAGPQSVYLLPPAVLQAMAGGTPKPRRLYYTAVGYQDREGGGAVFAHQPETLAGAAPFVEIATDFRGSTLATVLGIPAAKLHRFERSNNGAAGAASAGSGAHGSVPDASTDRMEGEDGYGQAPPAAAMAQVAATPDLTIEDPGPTTVPAESAGVSANGRSQPAELHYDDGYDGQIADLDHYGGPELSQPAQRTATAVAHSAEVPAALEEDEETPYWNDDGVEEYSSAAHHPAGRSQRPYGDEAEEATEEEFELDYEPLDGPVQASALAAPASPLDIPTKREIIEALAQPESGKPLYGYVNPDGEFHGRAGSDHPAYQRYHLGLRYGIGRFGQDEGALGRLLTMMQQRDRQAFQDIFGPHGEQLLQVTNASGPGSDASPSGRSARVQPVGGADLWERQWLERFARAAQHPPFQAAQHELTASLYLDPMLEFSRRIGLNTDRALAAALALAVELGAEEAQDWIAEAAGPVSTPALRQQALAALGYEDLASFQAATPGLEADGQWYGLTHASMTAALRQLGANSPVPVPGADQMLAAIRRRAAGQPWQRDFERLMQSSRLRDRELQF